MNKLHLSGTAIDAVSADDHYYYGVSNLNDYGYLTQMNFKEKKVNEIKEKSRFSYMVVPSHSKVYNFVDIENDDYSRVIAPVVADLCTTPVALSAPPNSFQNNSQS